MGSIIFDRDTYSPGEIVHVTFSDLVTGSPPIKRIELSLTAFEEVTVKETRWISNVQFPVARTARLDLVSASSIVDMEDVNDKYDLSIILPSEMLSTMNYSESWVTVKVALEATIHYETIKGKNQRLIMKADVFAKPPVRKNQVSRSKDGVSVSIMENVVTSGRPVLLQTYLTNFDRKYRSVRILLVTIINADVNKFKRTEIKEQRLIEFKELTTGVQEVMIPYFTFPSQQGKHFKLSNLIKIVIDRPRASDINIELPIWVMTNVQEDVKFG